jgi:hypothetical protein
MNAKKNDEGTERSNPREGAVGGDSVPTDDRILTIVDQALRVQAPAAARYVEGMRRRHPDLSDDELVARTEAKFLSVATSTGAGVGGVAALPGVGTAVAVVLTTGEGVAFAEECAFLALVVAAIRGVDMSEPAQRRVITLAILGGEKGEEIISKALGKQGLQWTTVLNGLAPEFLVNAVNEQVKRWIRKKLTRKLGSVWAARLIPFGIGAVIGGVASFAVGRGVIAAERSVFSNVDRLSSASADGRGVLDAGTDGTEQG